MFRERGFLMYWKWVERCYLLLARFSEWVLPRVLPTHCTFFKGYLLQMKTNKLRKAQCPLLTSRMSCLSSHLSTSGPSSVSALYIASLAMRMAAASWSKDAAMFWIWVWASAQFLAIVVTRMRLCPLECWYWVTNWTAPRPPWGIGALCCMYKNKEELSKIQKW